jgi:hypothetical protein
MVPPTNGLFAVLTIYVCSSLHLVVRNETIAIAHPLTFTNFVYGAIETYRNYARINGSLKKV